MTSLSPRRSGNKAPLPLTNTPRTDTQKLGTLFKAVWGELPQSCQLLSFWQLLFPWANTSSQGPRFSDPSLSQQPCPDASLTRYSFIHQSIC